MADLRKIVKVFLASPGHLKEERLATKSVIDEHNKLYSAQSGYHVELVGWEDTVSQFGRPQALINSDLDQCELFIGMLWKKWGTPPDTDGKFGSGFEEEFERSLDNRRKTNKPEISLLFKGVEEAQRSDPGPELQKVLKFQERLIAEKLLLFETFTDVRSLESKIRAIIVRYIQLLSTAESDRASEKDQIVPSNYTKPANNAAVKMPVSEPVFSKEGSAFIQEILLKTNSDGESQPLSNVEVARLRLLGTVVSMHGNDTAALGVHDSNLLFANRKELTLGGREKSSLIDAGLEHIASENTPLWGWIVDVASSGDLQLLWIFSFFGANETRVGALRAMKLIREPLSNYYSGNREQRIEAWLSSDSPKLRGVALEYLAACGLGEDLPSIRREYERGDYSTIGPATTALLRISLRDSRENAIKILYELQPDSIDDKLVDDLFSDGSTLDSALLVNGVNHRSGKVRARVASLLAERNELDVGVAEQLLADADLNVRHEALLALLGLGREFSEKEAKALLVRQTGGGLFSIASGYNSEGEAKLELFRREKYRHLPESDLEKLADEATVFNLGARFALLDRRFKRCSAVLRQMVDDQCERAFKEGVAALAAQFTIDPIDPPLEGYLRKEHTRRALQIISRRGGKEDLGRVRKVLKSKFVSYNEASVDYLRRFGEWEDIEVLINVAEMPDIGASLLSPVTPQHNAAARAIVSIADYRIGEVLSLKMSASLLAHVVVSISNKRFRELHDSAISQLFVSEDDRVRKATALKCIRALPKTRLVRLLSDYMREERQRYYNVIYWLDFGASLSKGRAEAAAGRVIDEEWIR
ncbi:protein of unknown function [Rhizobiales bacterium GAS113]|nr:protein of unknown function [Rhizobiales bacterium GAS113]